MSGNVVDAPHVCRVQIPPRGCFDHAEEANQDTRTWFAPPATPLYPNVRRLRRPHATTHSLPSRTVVLLKLKITKTLTVTTMVINSRTLTDRSSSHVTYLLDPRNGDCSLAEIS